MTRKLKRGPARHRTPSVERTSPIPALSPNRRSKFRLKRTAWPFIPIPRPASVSRLVPDENTGKLLKVWWGFTPYRPRCFRVMLSCHEWPTAPSKRKYGKSPIAAGGAHSDRERTFMLGTVLVVLLILLLLGALPTWPHSKNWGYGPTGGLGLVLVILVVLVLLGKV